MEYQEYPKAIYKGQEVKIVQNKQEEDAAPEFGAWGNPFEQSAEPQTTGDTDNALDASTSEGSAPAKRKYTRKDSQE
jgi:hypothetical protein